MLSSKEIVERMRTVNRCMKDSIDEKNPDASIATFIREVGSTLEAWAIYIFSLEDKGTYRCSYFWKLDGSPLSGSAKVLSDQDIKTDWVHDFHAGNTVIIDEVKEFPALYSDYDTKRLDQKERSVTALTPLILEKELFGFVVIVDLNRRYLALENQLFEIEANFIAIMLRHKHNADYILESSAHDELTGVLSINSFWNYHLRAGKPRPTQSVGDESTNLSSLTLGPFFL